MATTSLVRGNLLLLSSKRSQSLHTNPCSIKSIEFRGLISSSRLNKVRLKCNTIKSNLRSASNNMVTPFKFEAPFKCSSSKENAFGKSVIDNISRVLQWLKVPATMMAWSLLLGMIMYHHQSALALSGGSMGRVSFSSSRSRRSHYSSYKDRPKSSEEVTADSSSVDEYGSKSSEKVTAAVAFAILLPLIYGFVMAWANVTTVFKIQVGLLVSGEGLKRDLNRIAKSTNTSNSSHWDFILKETIKSLCQYRRNWISSCSYVEIFGLKENVKERFNNLSNEERKKFDEEILFENETNVKPSIFYDKKWGLVILFSILEGLSNFVHNMKKKTITSPEEETTQTKNTYMVVTILVALEGRHQLPTISDGKDLHDALKKLKSNHSKIQAVNVLWGPQKVNEISSLEVLQKKYPLLKSFNT